MPSSIRLCTSRRRFNFPPIPCGNSGHCGGETTWYRMCYLGMLAV